MIDTHCHIHGSDYALDSDQVLTSARAEGLTHFICVGTDGDDSVRAVEFAQTRDGCYASIGLHPHDAKLSKANFKRLAELAGYPKVVAVGECGLDYYYEHSPKTEQIKALRAQIELAQEHDLPLIFHVREAFADFWSVFDDYQGLSGVIHSFTAGVTEVEAAISRGLFVGLNGIMTFTKDERQLAAARAVPLTNLVLETDAPFLTPTPYRGTINEPRYVGVVADFLSNLRQEDVARLKEQTSANAKKLFKLEKTVT